MRLNEYQDFTLETAIYPGAGQGTLDALAYTALGLAGEVGEIVNSIKKVIRDETRESLNGIEYEMGDALYYFARLADELGVSLQSIASDNIDKLLDRKERGVIGGSGDER